MAMKLKFKNQAFQEAATAAVCDVFAGQPYRDPNVYTVDPGRRSETTPLAQEQGVLPGLGLMQQTVMSFGDDEPDVGYRNAEIGLSGEEIVRNLHEVQDRQNLEHSSLGGHAGRVTLL